MGGEAEGNYWREKQAYAALPRQGRVRDEEQSSEGGRGLESQCLLRSCGDEEVRVEKKEDCKKKSNGINI